MTDDAARRFVADAGEDLAVGIGDPSALRFVGMSLYAELKLELSDNEIYELLPNDGRAAMTRDQLLARPSDTQK